MTADIGRRHEIVTLVPVMRGGPTMLISADGFDAASLATVLRPRPFDLGRPPGLNLGPRNELLAALPPEDLAWLGPRLERIPLRRRQVIQERNVPVSHAYFIERGAASLLARAGERGTIEVGTLGVRDLVGVPLVLGTARSPHRCLVQVPGEALRIAADDLGRAMDELPRLRQLLLGYVQAAMVQCTQLVVCNSCHTLGERLARWLLVAHEQLDSDEVPLTHQSLSRALGVRRASVTQAMGRLEEAGLVRRGRGQLVILDRAGLEQASCDCYRAIRAEHQRVLSDVCDGPACVRA